MKYFERLQPLVAFCYFAMMLLVTLLTMHPILLAICLLSGVVFCGMLTGFFQLLKSLSYSIPLMIMIALLNPMFVHRGETMLFFLNDNPVTLEAVFCGVFQAAKLMAVYYWCKCYSYIMTSDKFLYLFGKILPKLSLVLSMALAFIPKAKRKYREIDEAQKALGIYATQSYVDKLHSKLRVLAILVTNSVESSAETADSMRARGYGLKGRSCSAIYRLSWGDGIFAVTAAGIGLCAFFLIFCGVSGFSYYPVMNTIRQDTAAYFMYSTLLALGCISTIMEVKDNILWHCLRSKI